MAVVLKTKHIIMLSKLVSKMNVKIDFTEKDATKLGTQVVMDLICNIHLAEKEFYELLGSISGYTPEKAADMPIEELSEELNEVVKKVINFTKRPAESTT